RWRFAKWFVFSRLRYLVSAFGCRDFDHYRGRAGSMDTKGACLIMGSLIDPATNATRKSAVLSVTGITKFYGHVMGLEDVDLEVFPGEVLAIIGDNGAGKSTLINILSGALAPDKGQIFLGDEPTEFRSPRDAQAHG